MVLQLLCFQLCTNPFLLPFRSLQVSVQFADLHDTPGRMQEKGVISVSVSIYVILGHKHDSFETLL